MPQDRETPIEKIGPKTAARLRQVGIDSVEELAAIGAVEAYKRLKLAFPQDISLNALYGMQALLLGIHWTALTPEMKAELKALVKT